MDVGAVLRDAKYTNLSLYYLVHILPNMCDDKDVTRLVKDYCMQMDNSEARHHGLEFLLVHHYMEEFQTLLQENTLSKYPYEQSWGRLYELYYRAEIQNLSSFEMLHELKEITIYSDEQRCMQIILELYSYYKMNRFDKIGSLTDELGWKLEKLEPSIIKDSYTYRLYEILQRYHWRRNELLLSRKYGYRILQNHISPRRRCKTQQCLGMSYLFDGYDQGIFHLQEALQIAEKWKLTRFYFSVKEQNIPFLSAYYKKTEGITSCEPSEQAHLAIANGNTGKAIAILNTFVELSPFQKYYLGLAAQNEVLLLESYNDFITNMSHHFYARLPLRQLHHS
ncbi:AimR family lysis-lysogeny pheromone receptor [Pontibacillus salicampi]|uniref:AimR family lysis-lysogeny pheromone receptor n=1 Tax=Pontibacillus salicampi TaxID=1449801 RepID=A0ABV6LS72_9BACI